MSRWMRWLLIALMAASLTSLARAGAVPDSLSAQAEKAIRAGELEREAEALYDAGDLAGAARKYAEAAVDGGAGYRDRLNAAWCWVDAGDGRGAAAAFAQ